MSFFKLLFFLQFTILNKDVIEVPLIYVMFLKLGLEEAFLALTCRLLSFFLGSVSSLSSLAWKQGRFLRAWTRVVQISFPHTPLDGIQSHGHAYLQGMPGNVEELLTGRRGKHNVFSSILVSPVFSFQSISLLFCHREG